MLLGEKGTEDTECLMERNVNLDKTRRMLHYRSEWREFVRGYGWRTSSEDESHNDKKPSEGLMCCCEYLWWIFFALTNCT